jgi:uncharacterized protein
VKHKIFEGEFMVTQKPWGKLFIIIILLGLSSTHATAASFDCKKAASWVEKTVCSNPELSKLDEQMAKAYHDALASLSPEGQQETKQYQKQWLKEISFIRDKRSSIANDKTNNKVLVIRLEGAYKKRIKQLNQILIKFPDRIFKNVHVMHLETKKKCSDEIVKRELIYPQIENPHDKNEESWNIMIAQKASDALKNPIDNECTDIIVENTVSFSNKHLVSVSGEQYWHAHGTPHGYTNRRSFSWLLEDKRELQSANLFDDKIRWRSKLVALVSQKLKEDKEESYKIKPSALMDIVTSPSHWVFVQDGLGIQFGEYELGSRSAPLIIIDWKTLDPYISKNGKLLISDNITN